MTETADCVIIGGGAAGFFAAVTAKRMAPHLRVLLLERSSHLLGKVRISGGGRCNVTHACFDPKQLVQNYPRGSRELLGPFHRFQPRDTIAWYESRGVELKAESDGRMFPTTDSSETIIACLQKEARDAGVEIRTQIKIKDLRKEADGFHLEIDEGAPILAKKIMLATGSHPQGHTWARSLGHTIASPVPSLFTFNIPGFSLVPLAGIAVDAEVSLENSTFVQRGRLLITHWGFSGPAALKLSAWAARLLHERNYETTLNVDWAPEYSSEALQALFQEGKSKGSQQTLANANPLELPKNLWKALLQNAGIDGAKRQSDCGKALYNALTTKIKSDKYLVRGKTTHKEEFVTCGGVELKGVDFKTMESKFCPGLYFGGEILDIDAVTGGFNFQNAWTTGFLAGNSMAG